MKALHLRIVVLLLTILSLGLSLVIFAAEAYIQGEKQGYDAGGQSVSELGSKDLTLIVLFVFAVSWVAAAVLSPAALFAGRWRPTTRTLVVTGALAQFAAVMYYVLGFLAWPVAATCALGICFSVLLLEKER